MGRYRETRNGSNRRKNRGDFLRDEFQLVTTDGQRRQEADDSRARRHREDSVFHQLDEIRLAFFASPTLIGVGE